MREEVDRIFEEHRRRIDASFDEFQKQQNADIDKFAEETARNILAPLDRFIWACGIIAGVCIAIPLIYWIASKQH